MNFIWFILPLPLNELSHIFYKTGNTKLQSSGVRGKNVEMTGGKNKCYILY